MSLMAVTFNGRRTPWTHSILSCVILLSFMVSYTVLIPPGPRRGRDTIDLSLDTTVQPVEIPAVHSFSSYVH